MTYIKELIELPDQVRRGDFVLKLSEGVTNPQETVANYVVTDQLVKCFDEALSLIRSAIDSRSSKAAYLHGSFGSGKSHFMAILHLLLQGNSDARSIQALAPIVAKHNQWTQEKRVLLIPYHMIAKTDFESAILGGYVDYVAKLHPEAPTPGVYQSDKIFNDAKSLRQNLGDVEFFKLLNKDKKSGSGWGAIESGWDAESFEIALVATPTSEERKKLVGDLIDQFYSAAKSAAEFVNIDDGLSIISKHAKSLGYDGLILFLDELILWLASHAADIKFVNNEGPKLSKLVEAQTADRPIPIISFVARQRDLKELVGDHITGAELLSFSDILKYWEARFSKISLEDRNLPAIAEKRVLKPKNEAARQIMDDEFSKTAKIRGEVMDVLLTSNANRELFRKVYPFSPALVETLIAVSFLLQRERTALKVMLQLLVSQRDTLKLGDIVPVGDLFDLISEGDEAFSDVMKVDFDNAKKLYHQKLKPLLEQDHKLTFEDMKQRSYDDLAVTGLRNDDRLVKTLLLSALAPNVESLRGLTASRLAALNHGTIKSPIQGKEAQIVLNKCRKWAAEVGQIKIGEDATNPSITVQLTGIDTDAIIQKALSEDNPGNRTRKIKQLLLTQIGVTQQDSLHIGYEYTWRATKRSCEIVFANVWQLTDETLKNTEDNWRVIIDYPIDPEGRSPKDDVARIEAFRQKHQQPHHTIVWLPLFFSQSAKKDLATLIKLDYILNGERFSSYVTHLSPADREAARTLLENQRSQLQQRMIKYLDSAYGISKPDKEIIDQSFELSLSDQFQSLDDGLTLKPPIAPNLKQGFHDIFSQALAYQFPAHPEFDSEVKLTPQNLNKVYEEVKRALQSEDGRRIDVDKEKRKDIRAIANPLKIGEMAETHFVLGNHWEKHFSKKEAEYRVAMTVGKLKQWIDEPQAMGLPRNLQNLIISVFALQTRRAFYLHGSLLPESLDNFPDDTELKEQKLPDTGLWAKAVARSREIFDLKCSELLTAENLARLVDEIRKKIIEIEKPCGKLGETLRNALKAASQQEEASARLKTAEATRQLINKIKFASDDNIVAVLANAEIPTTETAMSSSIKRASEVDSELSRFKWDLVDTMIDLKGEGQEAALRLVDALKDALVRDEYAIALTPQLKETERKAIALLKEAVKTKAPVPIQPPQPVAPPIVQPIVQPIAQPIVSPMAITPEPLTLPSPLTEVRPIVAGSSPTIAPRKSLASGSIEVKGQEKEKLQEIFTQMKKMLENDSKSSIKIDWEVFKN